MYFANGLQVHRDLNKQWSPLDSQCVRQPLPPRLLLLLLLLRGGGWWRWRRLHRTTLVTRGCIPRFQFHRRSFLSLNRRRDGIA
jgi:hypothetical protein